MYSAAACVIAFWSSVHRSLLSSDCCHLVVQYWLDYINNLFLPVPHLRFLFSSYNIDVLHYSHVLGISPCLRPGRKLAGPYMRSCTRTVFLYWPAFISLNQLLLCVHYKNNIADLPASYIFCKRPHLCLWSGHCSGLPFLCFLSADWHILNYHTNIIIFTSQNLNQCPTVLSIV